MTVRIDVTATRSRSHWNRRILGARILWALVWPLFRFSPRPCWAWRRMILRGFGAHVGRQVHVYPTARITMPWHLSLGDQAAIGDHAILYAMGLIKIGPRATVSQYAHLCAGSHDLTRADRALTTAPIIIGAGTWVCTDAFVGPGVTIGEDVILGARAVTLRDLPAGCTAIGNPVQILGAK